MGNDNRRYYYLKLKENFYKNEPIIILENMPDGMLYSNLLIKLYLMSLKYDGILMVTEEIRHSCNTIALITRLETDLVEQAMKVFLELGFIEILTSGAYYMTDIQLYIGQSSSEGERKQRQRKQLQAQKLLPVATDTVENTMDGQVSDKCPPILENRDKSIDIKDKRERDSITPPLGKYKNIFLTEQELEELKVELPTEYEERIERLSEYMASTGKNYNSHIATIRKWFREDKEKGLHAPFSGNKEPLPSYEYKGEDSL